MNVPILADEDQERPVTSNGRTINHGMTVFDCLFPSRPIPEPFRSCDANSAGIGVRHLGKAIHALAAFILVFFEVQTAIAQSGNFPPLVTSRPKLAYYPERLDTTLTVLTTLYPTLRDTLKRLTPDLHAIAVPGLPGPPYLDRWKSMDVVVLNTGTSPAGLIRLFERYDARMEAFVAERGWIPIETIGDSLISSEKIQRRPLRPNRFLVLSAPVYAGDLDARLRIAISSSFGTVYTQTFTGRIRSSQIRPPKTELETP